MNDGKPSDDTFVASYSGIPITWGEAKIIWGEAGADLLLQIIRERSEVDRTDTS